MRMMRVFIYCLVLLVGIGESYAAKKPVSALKHKTRNSVMINQIGESHSVGPRLNFPALKMKRRNDLTSTFENVDDKSSQNGFIDNLIDVSGVPDPHILSEFGLPNIKDVPILVLLFPQQRAENMSVDF